ncbi:peptide-methionine (S)-S-oxide reductase MsrA [Enterobacter kobei]|uniref:peptide-methionine (S)-S-oxide reductase MsrA n=1 Tax=Enterobacter kobei TaxID=208224 RepID=UPI00314536FE
MSRRSESHPGFGRADRALERQSGCGSREAGLTVAHTEEGERTVSQSPTGNRAAATERAILAGGCFWGMEDLLRRARGVISTRVGYTGGEMPDPTYARHYGHAEAVEVTFDPSVLAYRSLLELFFQIHDPTTYEQQGSDVGPSYRSAIFYTTEVQKEVALTTIAEIEASGSWPGPVVSEINPGGYSCHFVRPTWRLDRSDERPAVILDRKS